MEALLRVEARVDLQQAAMWYEEQQPGLGGEFLDDFLATIDIIENRPELYAEVDTGIRRALLRRFPYAMYYHVEATHIQVIAIKHTHIDPSKRPSRT
jgi:plasmid stabilization system protein ParE